jgi:hypothetical protein
MADTKPENGCRCNECREIHSEFIEQFGEWPDRTHKQGQDLKQQRIENEASFRKVLGG